jgi:lipopolysaccharide transport system ATP-binding protein
MGAFNFSNDKGYFEIVIPNLYLRANTYSIKLLAFYKSTRAEDTLDIIEKATRITVLNGDLWEVGNINRNGAYSIFPGQFIF